MLKLGRTALHLAAEKGHDIMVELLLASGADANSANWVSNIMLT